MKKLFLFVCTAICAGAATAQNINGTFETWRTYNAGIFPPVPCEAPQGWVGTDSLAITFGQLTDFTGTYSKQLYKTTDKHSGTYAAKLVTVDQDTLGIFPCIMTNTNININFSTLDVTFTGGAVVTQRIASMTAWLKHVPQAVDDSADIYIMAVLAGQGMNGTDSVVGEGEIYLGATPNYTQQTIPIYYVNSTVVPDRIQIFFVSSDGTNPTVNTALYVDDATLNTANGVSLPVFTEEIVKCYPNPSTGTLYLNSSNAETLTWEAYASNGQLVATREFTNTATVQLNNMPAGQYFYRVSNKSKELVQTGKFSLK